MDNEYNSSLNEMADGVNFEIGKTEECDLTIEDNTLAESVEEPKKWGLRNRLRSPILWLAVAVQIVNIIDGIYTIATNGWDTSIAEIIYRALIEALTIFGIFNDPTSSNTF